MDLLQAKGGIIAIKPLLLMQRWRVFNTTSSLEHVLKVTFKSWL